MSLFGALNLGASALASQQAALQTTGNNIANAGNPDYTREAVDAVPSADQQIQPGIFVGTGVTLVDIQRQVDASLNERLRASNSDSQGATTAQSWLSQVESSFNALGTNNISTQMSTFFSAWSTLANNPQDPGSRQVVLSDGQNLANSFTNERTQLTGIQESLSQQISANAQTASGLAQQIAAINEQIATSSNGAGVNNGLLDQRDAALTKLSKLMNVQTTQQPDGTLNVYVGSEPLVNGAVSNPLSVQTTAVTNQPPTTQVIFSKTLEPLALTSGQLGAMQNTQQQISGTITQLDGLAHNLIAAVNQIHGSGQGLDGITSATASNAVKDPAAALNSAAAGLQFAPTNGSFVVHVKNSATGLTSSSLVKVNLTGSAGDTTLSSLAASLNAIGGVSATINAGKLTIAAASPGSTISFSQDSSNTLAALGVNNFFTGSDASDVAVSSTVQNNPRLIAAAKNGDPGDNQSALAIAALNTQGLSSLNGSSLQDSYQGLIDNVAGQVATASTNAAAGKAVFDTLTAQQQSISGVSLDEESVNMLTQQRAYQGAAIFITTVNSMMTTLLGMIP